MIKGQDDIFFPSLSRRAESAEKLLQLLTKYLKALLYVTKTKSVSFDTLINSSYYDISCVIENVLWQNPHKVYLSLVSSKLDSSLPKFTYKRILKPYEGPIEIKTNKYNYKIDKNKVFSNTRSPLFLMLYGKGQNYKIFCNKHKNIDSLKNLALFYEIQNDIITKLMKSSMMLSNYRSIEIPLIELHEISLKHGLIIDYIFNKNSKNKEKSLKTIRVELSEQSVHTKYHHEETIDGNHLKLM